MIKACIRVFVVLTIFLLFAEVSPAQTDVVIAIDLSKSMRTNDPGGNRFTGADQFLTMFSLYGNNRGGVVAFGNDASDIIKIEYLSFDQAGKYKPILDRLGAEDWTELGKGLDRSKSMLGSSGRKRSIILISDGIVEGNPHARGVSAEQARDQAERELWGTIIPSLKSTRISVYTIGLFTQTNRGEATLQKIAHETGGFYTHVENPQEFPQIYKRMLDDIDQPSGVAELTNEQNRIVLTPFDQGVIIFGPTRFVVKAPNNMAYTTDRQTSDTPVKQKFFEYSNNTAILFLGRPDNIEQNGQFWNGKWSVEQLNGKGEATYISNVRLERDPDLPVRRDFFLNEFYPIEYQFLTQPGFDAETILSKCRAEYVLVPQGISAAKPIINTIGRQGTVFKGEQLLEKEGDYILQLKIYYEDTERWTQPPERFHVNRVPLVELSSPSEMGNVGYKFRIEAKESNTASANYAPELKGLADGVMSFTIRYGSDNPVSLEKTKADSDGVYRSQELEFRKAGDFEIDGLLNGKLLMQLPVENGDPIIKPYNIKARVFRKLKIEETTWGITRRWILRGLMILSTVASFLTIMAFVFRRPRFTRLDEAALVGGQGVRTINLEPQSMSPQGKVLRWFTKRSAVSIGGSKSEADITDSALDKGGAEPVIEIGVNMHRQYTITRTGTLEVCLNGRPLEPNQPQPISTKDRVDIPGVGTFNFVD